MLAPVRRPAVNWLNVILMKVVIHVCPENVCEIFAQRVLRVSFEREKYIKVTRDSKYFKTKISQKNWPRILRINNVYIYFFK